jgi:hypothetical protein
MAISSGPKALSWRKRVSILATEEYCPVDGSTT